MTNTKHQTNDKYEMMSRFLPCLALFLALASSANAERPNFIFFLTDDISVTDLGCYGNQSIKTPEIDKMAEAGLVFENAYLSTSSCSPSRCSMISGRYPHNTAAPELHTELPGDQPLFPLALKNAGYYTVISGKHHMGKMANKAFSLVDRGRGPGAESNWVELLQERPKDKPFFCWFASTDAHRGFKISAEAPQYKPEDVDVPPFLIDDAQTRADLAGYYHEVSRTDYYVGKLREELARQGVLENTFFIYCSDNGRPFPRCKTYLYDSGIKTPLVISCPTKVKPGFTSSLVSSIDFSATILELAGVEQDERIQGVSFAKVLNDHKAKSRDYVFAEHNWHVYQNHQRLARQGDLVYIRNAWPGRSNLCMESDAKYPSGKSLWAAKLKGTLSSLQGQALAVPQPAEELYDVRVDPHQRNNLAAQADREADMKRMRDLLDLWTQQTGDTVPANPTNDRYKAVEDGFLNSPRVIDPAHKRGEFPGAAAGARKITHPGPVLAK